MTISRFLLNQPLPLQIDNFTHNVWGGSWISQFKGLPALTVPVGESWEFSIHPSRPSSISLATEPVLSLLEVWTQYPREIFGRPMPFLLKFLDSNDNLSLQVHPSDTQAFAMENDTGKSEAWYILDVGSGTEDGIIYLGFNPEKRADYRSREDFEEAFLGALLQAYEMGPLTDSRDGEKAARLILPFLNKIRVQPGEAYRVSPGTIHAMGRGVRLFEIQENSDLTYRIWDWNRPEMRPLHLDKAKKVLNFHANDPSHFQIKRQSLSAEGQGQFQESLVIDEEENRFAVHLLTLSGAGDEIRVKTKSRFCVLTTASGVVRVRFSLQEGGPFQEGAQLPQGHSVLIPATVAEVVLISQSGEAQILKSL